MRKFILSIIAAFIFYAGMAQHKLEPYRVSIAVSDIEQASAWYTENLGFAVYKKTSFPQYDSLKIFFLKSANFELELLEKKTSFSIQQYVPKYNISDKPMLGYYKMAFKVNNLKSLYEKLEANQVSMLFPITYDKDFKADYFIVSDMDDNVIQFIQPR